MGKTSGECMNEPRLYQDEHDLEAMQNLLIAGRKACNGTYYVHTGDLVWWLYYPPLEGDFWEHIYLWDDLEKPGQLLGWALASPIFAGFDVFIQPKLRGNPIAQEMYVWAEEKALEVTRRQGKTTIYVLWVLHDDDVLSNHFSQRGYRLARGYVHLTRNLDTEHLPAQVKGEFQVRACNGELEVASRARAQYGAFGSSAPFERYLERFRNFMRSPVYCHNLDIVAIAPDGQIGAFCIVWMDPVNKVGLFEPVGTHPDYQRKGYGKAVMVEGIRRLQAGGMGQAIVSTFEDNPAAIKLYTSVGFRVVNRLGTYEKEV
jgi:ribosomal protein S18 acetylase RimI-like enzyme